MRGVALRLEGPMQSWGGPVAGDDRPSLDVPTKSGVLGIVAAALGIDRSEVERLAALHAGYAIVVRVDRRGTPGVDYHTTLGVPTASGKTRDNAVVSRRRYLYDACFTAVLVERKGAKVTPEKIVEALRHPGFAPYLGRRACPPSTPLLLVGAPLEGEDWQALLEQAPLPCMHDVEMEVHLDAELAPQAQHRPRRQRDVLIGRLPRLFGERTVHVIGGWKAPDGGDSKETIDPWLP